MKDGKGGHLRDERCNGCLLVHRDLVVNQDQPYAIALPQGARLVWLSSPRQRLPTVQDRRELERWLDGHFPRLGTDQEGSSMLSFRLLTNFCSRLLKVY
jgi:hypothetical protein